MMRKYNVKDDYPFYEKHRSDIKTSTGKSIEVFTIEAVMAGELTAEDCRISAEMLEIHAQIEDSAGNYQIAETLRKSAEMTRIPDDRIMEIYNTLRPRSSTKESLLKIVEELENEYDAPRNAAFIRDAIKIYEKQDMFK